jgi:hypothetical protein
VSHVISLFFQTALGLKPAAAAIALGPLMIGIIVASLVCRPLIGKRGRVLVIIGLDITLAGAVGPWGRGAVGPWGRGAVAPSILVLGVGMGACFSSIYDFAIGDVAPAEAALTSAPSEQR